MHEMSIALSIFDIALEQAANENASKIVELEMDIGVLAGIEFDALEFALNIAKKENLLENTRFKINKIKALALCLDCHSEFEMVHLYDQCPNCQGYNTKVIKGKELKVTSMLID